MANTITQFETGMHIVFDGSTDVDFATYFPGGILWTGVELVGLPGDEITIRAKEAAGVALVKAVVDSDTPGIGQVKWKEYWAHPYIDADDVKFTDVSKAYLIVRYI